MLVLNTPPLILTRGVGGGYSTSVECLFSIAPAHTDARRRRRCFNVGRVLDFNTPLLIPMRRVGGGDSTSVESLFSITPAHTDAWRRRRRRGFNGGRVLLLNTPPATPPCSTSASTRLAVMGHLVFVVVLPPWVHTRPQHRHHPHSAPRRLVVPAVERVGTLAGRISAQHSPHQGAGAES